MATQQAQQAQGAQGAERASGPDGRARSWRRRLLRARWPAGLAAAAVLLFWAYLQASRTQPTSSDGASQALQAWDMLHGNPLLRGWTLTDVSFYTTELPEYMIVEAVRGLHADVLHVSAAISYALLVTLGGLLARGRAKGRRGMLRMLIAAGIMVAPQLGPGVFILVFQPDHVGTQVPLLATWLVLDRAPRRWWTPVAVGAMLAWVGVADRLVLLIGVVPLAAVCAVRGYRAIVVHREPLPAQWFNLSLIAAAAAAAVVAAAAGKLISRHGGYAVLPLSSGLAPASTVPSHAWLAVQSVFGLYGADLFGMPSIGLRAAFALLHLVGLALAAWALAAVLRRFFRCEDLIAQVLAVAILVNLAAYVMSTTPASYWSARELAGVLPAGAVLAGRTLAGRFLAARLVPAMALVLAGYLAALGYTAAQPPVPAVGQDLAGWLAAHHLSDGLSGYGLANSTTLASGGAVAVRPVTWAGGHAAALARESDRAWYDPAAHDANFVVLLATPAPLDPIAGWQARDAFGRPAHTYRFGRYVIMTWDTNLLTRLSPSSVPG